MNKLEHTEKLYYLGMPIKAKTDEHDHSEPYRLTRTISAMKQFWNHGWFVYSPMLHWHHFRQFYPEITGEWRIWESPSLKMLSKCDGMLVFMLPGWDISAGLIAEINFAAVSNIPRYYITDPVVINDGSLSIQKYES